jgi:hypothetical protein
VNIYKVNGVKLLIKDRNTDISGSVSENAIRAAEIKLNLKFGSQYREFIKEFGALTVDHNEFYGIIKNNNVIPSAIFATLQNRSHSPELPLNVTVINDHGDGALYVVNSSDKVFIFDRGKLKTTSKFYFDFVIDMLRK